MATGLLAGKAALITGSTSGIGLAMARALAGAGANVALHGFGDPAQIQGIRDELRNNHSIETAYSDADLRKPPLIRDMVKQVHDQFGRLDILVNNAGKCIKASAFIMLVGLSCCWLVIPRGIPPQLSQQHAAVAQDPACHGMLDLPFAAVSFSHSQQLARPVGKCAAFRIKQHLSNPCIAAIQFCAQHLQLLRTTPNQCQSIEADSSGH